MAVLVYTEMSYLLAVRTGSQARAETDAAVYCIVAGDQGTTAQFNLTQPLSRQQPFRRAQAIHPLALLYAGRDVASVWSLESVFPVSVPSCVGGVA